MNKIANEKKQLDFAKNSKKVFFRLKDHSILQQVVLNTLLLKNNCSLEALASLLRIDARKLQQVLQGDDTLKGKKSQDLITLFYVLLN